MMDLKGLLENITGQAIEISHNDFSEEDLRKRLGVLITTSIPFFLRLQQTDKREVIAKTFELWKGHLCVEGESLRFADQILSLFHEVKE